MKKYTTLANSLTSSSIWNEDDQTRIVWITMLALCDEEGMVEASIHGLAHVARVTPAACSVAIAKLEAEDPNSRLMNHGGRRIQKVEGGWKILNFHHYHELATIEARREYLAERKREQRERQKAKTPPAPMPELEIPAAINTENFRQVWGEWVAARREKALRSKDFHRLFQKQLDWLGTFPPAYAIQMLEQSLRNGWTGIFLLKESPGQAKPSTIIGKKTATQQEFERMERDGLDAKKLREELEARSPIKNVRDPFEP